MDGSLGLVHSSHRAAYSERTGLEQMSKLSVNANPACPAITVTGPLLSKAWHPHDPALEARIDILKEPISHQTVSSRLPLLRYKFL